MSDASQKWEKDLEEVPDPAKTTEQPLEGVERKQLLDTGIKFHSERLMLETDSQETLDEFKKTYYRLERYFLGDYG